MREDDFTIDVPQDQTIRFFVGDRREVLVIEADGTLRLGEGATVDEVAKAFVDAVNSLRGFHA